MRSGSDTQAVHTDPRVWDRAEGSQRAACGLESPGGWLGNKELDVS